MTAAILSIAMLGGFALLWGAWKLWKRDGLGQKVWLMIAAALALFANVAIWTVPDDQGRSLVESRRPAPIDHLIGQAGSSRMSR